jgi:CRP/FNR family transcriptional regulator, dissimilatory nitrate respiration regulator
MVNPSVLDSVQFLKGLGASARSDLAARAVVKSFSRGQRLWTAGDEPRGLFVIVEGRVRVVRMPRGRAWVIHAEGPGATLGEVPLFAGGTYPATAIATEPTECLVLERRGLAAAMAAHPELAWVLLGRLAERLRHVVDRLGSQAADPVIARLAQYLLARAERAQGSFTLGGTQQAVAEDLGTAREVVVRLLRDLIAGGAIERAGPSRYSVRDRQLLAALADGAVSVPPSGQSLSTSATKRRR